MVYKLPSLRAKLRRPRLHAQVTLSLVPTESLRLSSCDRRVPAEPRPSVAVSPRHLWPYRTLPPARIWRDTSPEQRHGPRRADYGTCSDQSDAADPV